MKMFEHQCLHLGEQIVGAAKLEDACDLGPFGRGAMLHAVDEGERDFTFVQVLAGAFLLAEHTFFSGVRKLDPASRNVSGIGRR